MRTFQAGVVDRRNAGFAVTLASRGEELQGVGQLGQVADPVHAVRAGQRLPRAVGRGERTGVRRHQVLPGVRQADAEQHGRHVGFEGGFERRAQVRGVPDRLEDQGQHPGFLELQRVPRVGRGGGDEFLAGGDGQAEAEPAAGPQQRGEHRPGMGDQRDRPGRDHPRAEAARARAGADQRDGARLQHGPDGGAWRFRGNVRRCAAGLRRSGHGDADGGSRRGGRRSRRGPPACRGCRTRRRRRGWPSWRSTGRAPACGSRRTRARGACGTAAPGTAPRGRCCRRSGRSRAPSHTGRRCCGAGSSS